MSKHKGFKAFWVEAPIDLHEDTISLVARFATAMAEKLAKAQRKYGHTNNWQRDDWMDECRVRLHEHVKKGDPLDVANYCAFLWHHGESADAPPNLVAAAADLLVVAKHCENMLMRYEINRINGDEIADEALALIRAAISKATGAA